MKATWHKVTKKEPCEICHKPDWCTRSSDGAACCMRVESPKLLHNGGWLHKSGDDVPKPSYKPKPEPEVKINAHALWSHWLNDTTALRVNTLATSLGVSAVALHALGCAWTGHEYAFPMRSGSGVVVGIRLRTPAGDQFAVKGSKAGLFIPDLADFNDLSTLYVCEGCSDTAAMYSINLPAIGRPSCLGQEQDVNDFVRLNKVRRVVLVGDSDTPGERGAVKLQATLTVPSLLWFPPAKDARAAIMDGMTATTLQCLTKDLLWRKPA